MFAYLLMKTPQFGAFMSW